MHVVTGGAGFIGSHVVRALNARGLDEILVVDDLSRGDRFRNLAGARIADYLDRDEFRRAIERDALPGLRAILHQGACVDTTATDGRAMLENNFAYSRVLLHYALRKEIPLVYASSAAVYGAGRRSQPVPENENPANVYAFSKLLFDQYVRRLLPQAKATLAGLRYFNVYGPGEAHKGRMASMVYRIYCQLKATGKARLFEGTDGFGDGEQRRDFVFVEDAAEANLFFLDGPARRGVFNVGTGESRSFNEVARAIIRRLGRGKIEYIPFPAPLRGKYQSFTEADLAGLRAAGCGLAFTSLEEGIARSWQAWEEESL
ncbi:MAG: ADP-glyceromanno-heptose 6-epimerase [Planctomycetota bacterium]